MFNLIVAPILALMMFVSGCNSASPVVVNGIPITDVQSALKAACGFELLAGTAAAEIQLLVGSIPGLNTAAAIAAVVCKQVNSTPAATIVKTGEPLQVNVNGVLVHGRRVR